MFHICTADGQGGLAKYSFLCPNGTIFNQNYFICDWWFNFDCAQAETLYARNDEIRAEQEANIGAVAPDNGNGNGFNGGAQPVYNDNGNSAPVDYAYDDYELPTEAPAIDAPLSDYGVGPLDPIDEPVVEEEPVALYGAPAPADNGESDAARAARFFRNRNRNGRRQRNGRSRQGRRRFNGRRNGRRQGRRFQG